MPLPFRLYVAGLLSPALFASTTALGQLAVSSITPTPVVPTAARTAAVTVTANQPLSASSTSALRIMSRLRGLRRPGLDGTISVSGNQLTYTPNAPWLPGETLQVSLRNTLQGTGGQTLPQALVWQFTTAVSGGTGTFGNTVTSPGAASPGTLLTGDFDLDGDVDALQLRIMTWTPIMHLNNGQGEFTPTPYFQSDYRSSSLIETGGDVTGDGFPDVLDFGEDRIFGEPYGVQVRSRLTPNIPPYFANFILSPIDQAAVGSVQRVTTGDVDGDGDLDMITSTSANNVVVFANNGAGRFTQLSLLALPTAAQSISGKLITGDWDNDRDLDFAFKSGPALYICVNNGQGTFSSPVAVGSSTNAPVSADMDADGDLDLLVSPSANTLSVLRNNGSGVFTLGPSVTSPSAVGVPLTGDLDGDGDLDAVTAGKIFLNDGTGSFTISAATLGLSAASLGVDPDPLRLEDFDGDGDLDFLGITIAQTSPSYRLIVSRNLGTPAALSWTGAVSTSWTEPGNWSGNQVPTALDNVVIPGGLGRYPVLTASQAVRDLTLASGASFTHTAGTLSINGVLSNAGTLTQSGGSLFLTGSGTQTLGGSATTRLLDLRVGPGGAGLSGPVQVQRLLTLQGTLSTNAQPLTLLSDASGTAMVVNDGGAVTGAATVQRYIDPSLNAGAGYRHFSAPVSNTTVADLSTSSYSPVVNPAYNTAANPSAVTPFPTVFGYDPTRVSTAFDQGWASPAALTTALTPGRGYTANLAPQTVDFVGTLNNGSVSVLLSGAGTGNAAGWQLLGNPYPSPMDWNLVTRPAGLDNAVYVYRSSGPYVGSYVSYVNGIGPADANLLASGQGFFVHLSSGAPRIFFDNAARLTSYAAPGLYRTQETRPLLELALRRPGQPADVLYLYREVGASADFDASFDALKVEPNGGLQPTLYQLAAGQRLSIQGLPDGSAPAHLPLGVYAPAAGTYTFGTQRLLNFDAEQLYLEDLVSGQWHDLRQGDFTVQLAAGAHEARFVLHLSPQRPLAAKAPGAGISLQVYPNPSQATPLTVQAAGLAGPTAHLVLTNTLGQVVRQAHVPVAAGALRHEFPTQGLAAGVYALRLHTAAGILTRQIVLK